jgi:uncharacterized protein YndB with AHSA1/START domain
MMSTTESSPKIAPVKKSLEVAAPRDVAFRVFTAEMSSWWPLESHHIGKAKATDAVVEPFEGGRWYEKGEDGSECDWGRVLAWEPPGRVVLAWQISAEWGHDARIKAEVEVCFTAVSAGVTRVELEHRKLETFGDKAEGMRAGFEGPGGWSSLLAAFGKKVEAIAKPA